MKTRLRRVELDYLRTPRRQPWIGIALLVAGALCVAELESQRRALDEDVAELTARREQRQRATNAAGRTANSAQVPVQELQSAHQVARQLSIPWSALFQALEAAPRRHVRLTVIDPDPHKRTLRIEGHARNYLDVLNYVAALKAQSGTDGMRLDDVMLVKHDEPRIDEALPLAFIVTARWHGSGAGAAR